MSMSNAEMMERSATCFQEASRAYRKSPEHHAWKTAGELWRTQAGVKAPQESTEKPEPTPLPRT